MRLGRKAGRRRGREAARSGVEVVRPSVPEISQSRNAIVRSDG